jgi:hypothetical protein
MSDVFQTMIVTAACAPLARTIAAAISPEGGKDMFLTGLVPADGPADAEPTHYISTGKIHPQFVGLLADASLLHAAATAAGVDCTLADCQALVDEADVSEEKPFPSEEGQGALARLGLQIQQVADDMT